MAAVPSIGRASRVEPAPGAPQALPAHADLTRALYEQYANQIFRYCLHQLGSREEAEDAVQGTFLNAFRGIQRGIVPELESAWLFKIAHNVCLSRRRSTWRRGRIESPADFEVVEELAPAPSRRADELIGLQDVLEGMPENQRRAILLREWQGLSYREIAEELELSQAAVETLIFRARRSLAQGLETPPLHKRRRLARGADLGNLLAGAKSLLLGGGAAVKVAAAVAVVGASTVVAAAPVRHRAAHRPPRQAPAAPAASVPASAVPASPAAGPVSAPHPHALRLRRPPATPPAAPPAAEQPAAPVPASAPVEPQPAAPAPAAPLAPAPAPQPAAPPAQQSAPPAPAPPAAPPAAPAGSGSADAAVQAEQDAPVAAGPSHGASAFAPGQAAKGDPGSAPAQPGQPAVPPGQAKRADEAGPPATPPGPATRDDPAAPPTVPSPPPALQSSDVVSSPAAAPGNGNANGNGGDNGHGHGR